MWVQMCGPSNHVSIYSLEGAQAFPHLWNYRQMQHVWSDSLSVLLQFPVQPPVSLIGDEQEDDVSLVKAEQCAVIAGSVREDGAHT